MGKEGIEPSSRVLETLFLPLNYIPAMLRVLTCIPYYTYSNRNQHTWLFSIRNLDNSFLHFLIVDAGFEPAMSLRSPDISAV